MKIRNEGQLKMRTGNFDVRATDIASNAEINGNKNETKNGDRAHPIGNCPYLYLPQY